MVQCELCGADTATPTTVTVEEAELDVCDDCADLGTAVDGASSGGSSKYDTEGTETATAGASGATAGGGTGSGGGGTASSAGGRDPFDDLDEVDPEYGDLIRSARESRGWSQADLADRLNEKASLIRKLEREETLPSDEVQRELEGELEIDLSAGGPTGDADWDGNAGAGGTTLGDIVERKNS